VFGSDLYKVSGMLAGMEKDCFRDGGERRLSRLEETCLICEMDSIVETLEQ
jgi:hypothetical protein